MNTTSLKAKLRHHKLVIGKFIEKEKIMNKIEKLKFRVYLSNQGCICKKEEIAETKIAIDHDQKLTI